MKNRSEGAVETSFRKRGAIIAEETETEARTTWENVARGGTMTRRAAGEVETILKAIVEGTTVVGDTIEAVETGARLLLRECVEITGKSGECSPCSN